MPDETKYYECVITHCKNKDCGIAFSLQVIRELPAANVYTFSIFDDCKPFQERCPRCDQESTYSRGDISIDHLPNQIPGRYSQRFVDARVAALAERSKGIADGES